MSDLISREDAINALCDLKCGITRRECPLTYEKNGCEVCTEISVLEVIPAADPVKHGRWVYNQYDADPKIGNWHCSVCQEISIERRLHFLEYCPHCGARMDGEEDDEHDYERAIDELEHNILYEPTFNIDDGSM